MNPTTDIQADLLERIDDFILDRMDVVDRRIFEKEIEENAELRQTVETHRELIKGIELGALIETLAEIDESHRHHTKSTTNTDAQPVRYWYAVILGFLALIAISMWIYFKPAPIADQLLTHYGAANLVLPDLNSSHQFSAGLQDYRQQKYSDALQKWTALQAIYNQNDTLQYFIGMAHFSAGSTEKAIPYLESVRKYEQSAFREKSHWILILSWIKTGDFEQVASAHPADLPSYTDQLSEIKSKLLKNEK